MDFKQTILDSLEVLRKKEAAEKQVFKARAYAKVIQQIRDIQGPVRNFGDLSGISGIGEKIQAKLQEIFATGALAAAERAKQSHNLDVLELFQGIYGVGPVKAEELIRAGFRTIADLRANPASLNDKQRIGLRYYEELLERIPRSEMDQHAALLAKCMCADYEITGSYRRGALDSGDIDILVCEEGEDEMEVIAESLKQEGYLIEILAEGERRLLGICRLAPGLPARRIDIILIPAEEYAFQLLYFTGSAKFNVAMRSWALDRGYSLKEFNLIPLRADMPLVPYMKRERDVFAFLGLRYIPPEERVDHRQILPL